MQSTPQSLLRPPSPSNIPNGTNTPNIPGSQERHNNFAQVLSRSKQIRRGTKAIISTRAEFVHYLKKNGLNLITSAVLFQRTHDFIQSSFIIYPYQNNLKEPLVNFLNRYPDFKPSLEKINRDLHEKAPNIHVITRGEEEFE